MMIRPRTKALRSRLFTTLLCGALLVIGSGCVSWDPIFRGSMRLASLLLTLI
ncbi:hypothetical protein [Algisphaera agarilytica]|uniref:Uncharacterized protein n=1 Tax=Algisphaera agarilytica TaxID=1385975 RepID=A0A7X0H8R7_9BACT|nr:hypothetical protein [Algisphaera agarilytica]MBB6431152.1 hypothetical protein [Algisphaera agarilytica]